eukprot:8683417-Alexandrium_andersonii.AAC.1
MTSRSAATSTARFSARPTPTSKRSTSGARGARTLRATCVAACTCRGAQAAASTCSRRSTPR